MAEAVIVSTARSPIGRANKGTMTEARIEDLSVQMLNAALGKVPELDPKTIDDLILGCGQPAGESGNNLARVVAVAAGLDEVPGTTVNRYCSSSLQTTRMAFHAIKAGEGEVFLSMGAETVSRFGNGYADGWPNVDVRSPLFSEALARTDRRAERGADVWHDPREDGLLPDVFIQMGQTAENLTQLTGITRQEQDEFGVRSQNLAEKAIANGFWERDITPIKLPDGTVISKDDGPRPGTTYEKVAALRPVFRPDGAVTAGNSCPLNDGAAALVIMSDIKARELGLTPLARVVATGVTGLSPEIMGLGPIGATRNALKNAGMSIGDIDLVEINEAFAVQVIASSRELGIPMDKININGGAIAVGHPFGMTGARITSTLINSLQFYDKQFGLETMCVGGGQGMALILERLS
jgi:acetyl-CoA C-acetyltransferase